MTRFNLTIDGKNYQVEIGDISSSPVAVTVNGHTYSVEFEKEVVEELPLAPPEPTLTPTSISPPASSAVKPTVAEAVETVEVEAPMPGKILSIKAQVGDAVKQGQVLCTLEAMKMEMTVGSPAEGIVTAVQIEVGQNVQYGDILFVIGTSK